MQGFFCRDTARGGIVNGKMQIIRVELKYCEACGALWLRPRSNHASYCRRCERVMAELSRTSRTKAAEGERP